VASSLAEASVDARASTASHEQFMTRFLEELASALDSFKALLQGGTGEVGISISAGVGDVLAAYTQLRTLMNLRAKSSAGYGAVQTVTAALRSAATGEVLTALQRALTTDNPGGEVQTDEAKRQLLFFCNSLRNRWMPECSTVRRMRSISSFTPHYAEDVTYSLEQLKNIEHRDDGVNLEHLLQSLFAQEWANFCERLPQSLGLKWKRIGERPPSQGVELDHAGLRQALAAGITEFSREDFELFNIRRYGDDAPGDTPGGEGGAGSTGSPLLRPNSYVRAGASYFKPVMPSEEAVPTSELAVWASDRAQVLSRTVRGVMLYADALRIQARLEGVHEKEVEAVVASKFEYVITCQIYAKLRDSKKEDDRWKARCIDELRRQFAANLKIAYVETVKVPDAATGKDVDRHYSVLLGVDPASMESEVRYKVKLPGNPIIGEGKPENQNHAIIFTRGEHMQTLDMNQDNYLGEAMKLRNMLECFTGTTRLVGCREHIFSEAGGAVAAFAASNEFVFGTSLQRFLTYPLSVRFHYGHPDTWDKQWAITNGGVSKASRTLHLSEDIFAGFNCVMRGGGVVYQEFIHVGKGRDMGFIAINGFEQKISAGNALQSTSRELYRLGKNFDLPRLLSFYFTGTGFFITQRLTSGAIYLLTLAFLVNALINIENVSVTASSSSDGAVTLSPEWDVPAGLALQRRSLATTSAADVAALTAAGDFFFNSSIGYSGQLSAALDALRSSWGSAYNLTAGATTEYVGTFTTSTYEANYGLLQLGFFSVLPYFLELWTEVSFSHAVWENVRLIGMGSWVFFVFASQTKGFRLAEAIRHGKAGYVATGRGYVIEPGSFIALYAVYAKSHIYTGFEVLCLLIVYHCFAASAQWGAVVMLWLFACSMLLAPYAFNPQSLSTNTIAASFEELLQWFAGEADAGSKDHLGSWSKWHNNRLAVVRGSSLLLKVQDHVRILLLRVVMLLPTAARLEIKADSLPSSRFTLLLLAGGLMCAAQVLIYLLASERTLCGLCVRGLDGATKWLGWLYRLIVTVAVSGAGCFLLHELVKDVIAVNWNNVGLLLFAALLISTYVLQLLVTLEPPKPPPKGKRACSEGPWPPVKRALIAYADAWYYLMDAIITSVLIGTLSILSLLPLLRLQSKIIFNRDFAMVISTKLSRAELLKRILS
jgi:hypothetical protein